MDDNMSEDVCKESIILKPLLFMIAKSNIPT